MQNNLISKLKQTLIDKQYTHRFNELLQPTVKLNKSDKNHLESIPQPNALLPSISNAKLSLNTKKKSLSAKKLPHNKDLEKSNHSKSSKKLANQQQHKEEHPSSKKPDFEDLIVKKQSVEEGTHGKQTILRTKLFSLRTPSRQSFRTKDATKTKDVTASHERQSTNAKNKHLTIKEFNSTMSKLNQELLLSIKSGSIDSQNLDNKKIMVFLNQLKSNREEEYLKVHRVVQKLLAFIQNHSIKNCSIQFKSLLKLVGRKVYSNYELVNTFYNKAYIIANHTIAGLQYYTFPEQKGKDLAAAKITSLFKMIFSKRFYKNLNGLIKKVKTIQKYWRMCLLVKRTRKAILERTENKLKAHNSLQKQFCSQWNIIKTTLRFEIHICSYSLEEFKRLTTNHLKQKENIQITRLFKAMETDVSVIYVCPFQLREEIIKYYYSIFNFNQYNNIQQKIYFVTPENRTRIEEDHCSITTVSALLYSPKALKRIKQIIGKQPAYIIPSFPSIQYTNLSAELQIPLLSSNPCLMKLYSTKSGAKKLLTNVSAKEKALFHVPKSVVSIFSQKELINSLSILIFRNRQIKMWYLKIQDQVNSRGLAYLNVSKISFLRQICSGTSDFQDIEETQMIKLIAQELQAKLKMRLKIVNKDVYPNYEQYISHFLTRGGVIEGGLADKQTQFSISFLIQPSGEFKIIGTYNKIQLGAKSINQSIRFPSNLKGIDYEGITRNLYKELFIKQKLYGYFTCDFVYCHQSETSTALGLDCFLNQKTSAIFMVNFCCNSHYEKDINSLNNLKDQTLYFTYCPSLTLKQLPSMPTFFKNCKFQNISFDLQRRLGTLFVLIDQLESQQIGLLIVEESEKMVLKELKKMVEYFCRVFRQGKNSHDEIGLLKGAVTTSLKQEEKKTVPKNSNNYLQ